METWSWRVTSLYCLRLKNAIKRNARNGVETKTVGMSRIEETSFNISSLSIHGSSASAMRQKCMAMSTRIRDYGCDSTRDESCLQQAQLLIDCDERFTLLDEQKSSFIMVMHVGWKKVQLWISQYEYKRLGERRDRQSIEQGDCRFEISPVSVFARELARCMLVGLTFSPSG
ncbi:hypothetical protein MRB53_041423 [Persea americana]|nr:hypothetical protein MRB53_041423 [Persea americana]